MSEPLYSETVRAYTDGVRALFGTAIEPTGARDLEAPAWPRALADEAEELAATSAVLTDAAASQLSDPDLDVRSAAEAKLLAKAMTDLQISAYLFEAAVKEEGGPSEEAAAARDLGDLGSLDEYLSILLGEQGLEEWGASRDLGPENVPTARTMLSNSISTTLGAISKEAQTVGQTSLGGLMGLGMVEVAKAAGIVGMEIAGALGQAEKVARLYAMFREFALRSYNSIVALLGQNMAQMAGQKVLEWLNDLKEGKLFGDVLEKLYETKQTSDDLQKTVAQSPAALEKYVTALDGITKLDATARQQADLAKKLLRGMAFFGSVPATALPGGKVLMAAAYIALGGYAVFAGADFVDARRLKKLDRVPGVRRIVESNLGAA